MIIERSPEEAAKEKLKRIIEREGDMGGIRRDPEYLYQLMAEEIEFRRMKKAALLVWEQGGAGK